MIPALPGSTYRLQLNGDFPFAAAQRTLPYLARLRVTHVYLSPIWTSVPGSTHGYDVIDHAAVNPELGGLAGLRRFSARARELGLGIIVDFVPNHMGIQGGHNRYWEDVLRHGQASRYAHFFDISWSPLKRALEGKVLLPLLGDLYGRVLSRGELRLERVGGGFQVRYWERTLPCSPRSLTLLLREAQSALAARTDEQTRAELASIARSVENLPRSTDAGLTDLDRVSRAQETEVSARRLEALAEASPAVRAALDEVVAATNADPQRLDALLAEQNYRLAYWKVASEEINYRRFFDINDLAALRMEDPRVFAWAHTLLFSLLREGLVHGVRLDHTDGLYDPAGYFRALQAGAAEALGLAYTPDQPSSEQASPELPLYVVAEKILEPGEHLPHAWAIHGTTGYDFLAQAGGLFVNAAHEEELTGLYRRFTGDRLSYPEHLYHGKTLIQRVSLPGEVQVLAEALGRLSETDWQARDYTLSALRTGLREVVASFPVYRTYLRASGEREPGDNAKIARAAQSAAEHNRRAGSPVDPGVFRYLEDVLTLSAPEGAAREAHAQFALKFQQLTGPVTAKGAEDTAFYRYARLLSLNEVGSDPAHFGTPTRAFHAAAAGRAERWPRAMLSSSTHDTKRGEDTRARLHVLSELPQTWAAYLSEWLPLLRALEVPHPLGRAPSALDQYVLLQNALGAYPLSGDLSAFPDRLAAYMLKAAREAKLRTGWAAPDEDYEAALEGFTRRLLAEPRFLSGLSELHRRISPYGAQNGLSAALLRLSAPGVPDTYQGSEGWNQSLVDPDNRRPVDFAALGRRLARLERRRDPTAARALLERYETGEVKTLVTWAALQARRAYPELFAQGGYRPVEAGKYAVAFAREHAGQVAVTVAPRLTLTLTREANPWALGEVWGTRSLALPRPGTYENALTGEVFRVRGGKVALSRVLAHFPLALLISR